MKRKKVLIFSVVATFVALCLFGFLLCSRIDGYIASLDILDFLLEDPSVDPVQIQTQQDGLVVILRNVCFSGIAFLLSLASFIAQIFLLVKKDG